MIGIEKQALFILQVQKHQVHTIFKFEVTVELLNKPVKGGLAHGLYRQVVFISRLGCFVLSRCEQNLQDGLYSEVVKTEVCLCNIYNAL